MADSFERVVRVLGVLRSGWHSYASLESKCNVTQRTIQRWLGSVRRHFPDVLEECRDISGRSLFRLRRDSFLFREEPTPEERVALRVAVERVEAQQVPDLGHHLGSLQAKVEEAVRRSSGEGRFLAVARDMEDQLGTVGFASRPGPEIPVDASLRQRLHEAFGQGRVVRFDYTGPRGTTVTHQVEPKGILFGGTVRLVASPEGRDEPLLQYRLDRMTKLEVTGIGCVVEPEPFQEFVRDLFGSFRDPEVIDVEWRFRADAPEVDRWKFHPSQTVSRNPDGSLTVRFRATGKEDLARHVIGWWDWIETIEPESLRKVVLGMRLAGLAPLFREFGGGDIADRVEELAGQFARVSVR